MVFDNNFVMVVDIHRTRFDEFLHKCNNYRHAAIILLIPFCCINWQYQQNFVELILVVYKLKCFNGISKVYDFVWKIGLKMVL